eukprot:9775387-Heterocapsa_arctica.AAC.1
MMTPLRPRPPTGCGLAVCFAPPRSTTGASPPSAWTSSSRLATTRSCRTASPFESDGALEAGLREAGDPDGYLRLRLAGRCGQCWAGEPRRVQEIRHEWGHGGVAYTYT